MTRGSLEIQQAPQEYNEDRAREALREAMLPVNVQNTAAAERIAIWLQSAAETEDKVNMAGKSLLDARDRFISKRFETITGAENIALLEELHSEAFSEGNSGFEADIKKLAGAAEQMNEPWRKNRIIGEFNGNYRMTQARIADIRKKIPRLDQLPNGPHKRFYNFLNWMITELEKTIPEDKAAFDRTIAKGEKSLPEQQIDYAMKRLAIIGGSIFAAVFVLGLTKNKLLALAMLVGGGVLAYKWNTGLFTSKPEQMKEKLDIFGNSTFDRNIPHLTDEFARDIFDTPRSDIAKFKKRIEGKKSANTKMTDEDLEDLTILSDESRAILKGMSAQEAHDIVILLSQRSGTDAVSRESQNIIMAAIRQKANTTRLGQQIELAVKEVKAAEDATPSF